MESQGYDKMFKELLVKLSSSSNAFNENLKNTLRDGCELLHISKIEMITYQSEEKEHLGEAKRAILYEGGNVKEELAIHKRFVAGTGLVVIFNVFGIEGQGNWQKIEEEKIQVLIMILFTFAEKNKEINQQEIKSNSKAKEIEYMFPDAIANEEFQVYYQPKVALKDYSLTGAEALCRWTHEGKMVFPGDFIPVLESGMLICELDFYMLEHVCKDIRTWLDEGKKMVKISVNLSRKNIHTPNLLNKIISIIDKYKVPHELIEIELVETAGELNDEDLWELVNGLREYKVSTAVDDFGTGFSSLSLIRNLPWNVIKIDRSLLPQTADKNTEQYTMLRHLLTMLYDMGFKCIVEGVETVEQVKMLKENNCYVAQGFYFDRPLPKSDFATRLTTSKP